MEQCPDCPPLGRAPVQVQYLHDHYPDATYLHRPYTGRSGYTRSGYGSRLPTDYMVRIGKRLHRIRVMCWSNAGTAYVRVGGRRLIFQQHRHREEV